MAWQVVAASVQGASHERMGLPCQDAVYWKLQKPSLLLAAVADGAGSSAKSDIAAQKAAQTAVDWLADNLASFLPMNDAAWQTIAHRAAEEVIQTICTIAEENATPLQEYATTLIVAVVDPTWIGVCQIGDGAVVIRQDCEKVIGLSRPSVGEYLNETTFVTSESALETAQKVFWAGQATHIAVFSDGLDLLALKLPDYSPYDKFFDPLFKFVDSAEASEAHLSEFLRSSRVRERTDDDLTLLLATWKGDLK